MNKPWYTLPTFHIKTIETQDWGVTQLMGTETENGWEYAVVFWRCKVPHLICTFQNGKIIEDNGE